jgi:hypothetical protein
MGTLQMTAAVIRSTMSAAAGLTGGPFAGSGRVHEARLHIADEARLPGGTALLTPGRRAAALVRVTEATEVTDQAPIRSVCLKLPDCYGPGRDQDFLFASSADGAPGHHLTLPAAHEDSRLYSTLWLYLAGVTPTVFGLRVEHGGGNLEFLVSGAVGRFHRVGTLTVGGEVDRDVTFAARNSGGNIRPLPPVVFYRG